ncbi:dienelactone hydrolase family protein [Deinococcus sp. AJ005]|uniref:dienelactone hydrolase family protein n=1 Tax=Deinococcus sp. AJ005 TaxID=2652443 RepID=UPI00186580F6|nr:dienelactone hydrolase family protein [Deinococcus sp. AJ005]
MSHDPIPHHFTPAVPTSGWGQPVNSPTLPTGEPFPTLRIQHLCFPVQALDGTTLQIGARLQLPVLDGPGPAVVIAHGSNGIDSRGQAHALDLNRAGIATLEIDMWGARGLAGGSEGRPKAAWETLPDVFGAFAVLAAHPGVDARRIGIVGFSWGGVVSLLSATRNSHDLYLNAGRQFAAHAAFYPACWIYNTVHGYEFRDLTGASILILVGEQDRYDDPGELGPELIAHLDPADRPHIQTVIYPGAEHGFNMFEAPYTYRDPMLHRGQGGEGRSAPHPEAREAARQTLVQFFARVLIVEMDSP